MAEIRNAEKLERRNPLNVSLLDILRTCFPRLPESPVAAGESWTDSGRMAVPFQGLSLEMRLKSLLTVVNVLPSPEGRRVVVSLNPEITVSGRGTWGGVETVVEGRGAGSGHLVFLADKKYFLELRLESKIAGSLRARKGEALMGDWPLSLEVSVSLVGRASEAGLKPANGASPPDGKTQGHADRRR